MGARLKALEELARGAGAAFLAASAREARERVEAGEVWLVVLGQFKRGKSSLINALLGRTLLPTGVVPVTSVATVIRRGAEPAATVHLSDGTTAPIRTDELGDYITEEGNPGNHKRVERVEVRVPSDFLSGGLVLVDTPGIGSLSNAATEHAYAWIPRVDAALVVLSPDPPLGDGEAAYLRAIAGATRHLVFAFNKVDMYPEPVWREAMAYNRRTASEILGGQVTEIPFVATSADPHEGSATAVSVDELAKSIREFVDEAGASAALDAAERRFREVAGALHDHLALERSALATPALELEARMNELTQRRAHLEGGLHDALALLEGKARRLVAGAAESLDRVAAAERPRLEQVILAAVDAGISTPNGALAARITDEVRQAVTSIYEGWAGTEGEALKEALRSAMARAADVVEGAVRELRDWVAARFGVVLGPPPSLRELAASSDFYYRADALVPRTTFDVMARALPGRWFRARLRRRAGRLAAWELERNAGRVRGDFQYRVAETVRGFSSDLHRSVEEYRAGLEGALERAAAAQAEGEAAWRRGVESVDAMLARLEEIRGASVTMTVDS